METLVMANASIESAKSRGELGQPCLQPLDNVKVLDYFLLRKSADTSLLPPAAYCFICF